MADLGKVVYLSEAQKETLFTNGSITTNGQTIEYSDTDLYVTPSAIDIVPVQGSSNLITSGAVYNAIDEISDQVDQIKPSVTTAGSIAYYNDTDGTFASDGNLTWDSTNQTLTANKLKGYVTVGQKSGTTLGDKATAEGYQTTASGTQSHAEGSNTTASASYSHAEGQGATASAQDSHAEGQSTTASGTASHAEGRDTTASGNYSHAEGRETTASSGNSHAEGYQTTASNTCSHTEGYQTTASGYTSHVEGYGTTANHRSQHVFGEYNIVDDSTATVNTKGNYVEIVGNGTSDNACSNARTLDWNGNEVLAGKLTVGAAPTGNMDVATKQYVDNVTTIPNAGTVSNAGVISIKHDSTELFTIQLPLYTGGVSDGTSSNI